MSRHHAASTARFTGVLYAAIIVLGLTSELVFRGGLLVPGDAIATAAAITSEPMRLRWAVFADLLMAMADVGLAVLLYRLLQHVDGALAMGATAFRLIQAAVIGASLPLLMAAVELAGVDPIGAAEALDRHGFAYDLGLMFLGVNSVLTGLLIGRLGGSGLWLGRGLMVAGLVYMTGTSLRILSPELTAAFAPAYGLTVLAEAAVTGWLLAGGAWRPRRQRGDSPVALWPQGIPRLSTGLR